MTSDHKEPIGEVETALLDAELFIKYGSPDRAMKRLKMALERSPRSIALRERMREIAALHKHPEEAARHCLALASLYIERDDFDAAHDRLLEAKQLDNRISIAPGLEAIRRARHPEAKTPPGGKPIAKRAQPTVTFAGDLSLISVFDTVQVIENSRLTGVLTLTNETPDWPRVFQRWSNRGCGKRPTDCAGSLSPDRGNHHRRFRFSKVHRQFSHHNRSRKQHDFDSR